jgi:hypothetical protein
MEVSAYPLMPVTKVKKGAGRDSWILQRGEEVVKQFGVGLGNRGGCHISGHRGVIFCNERRYFGLGILAEGLNKVA